MKNKLFPLFLLCIALLSIVITYGILFIIHATHQSVQTQIASAHPVSATIFAPGTIRSQQEATLHFQTNGKLVYLPFKEGDSVQQGQTIAQLDTYALQRQLTEALNAYRSTRDTFDQTQANAQTGVLQGSQKNNLNLYSQSVIGNGDTQNTAINDAVQRIVDQNQANLDNSVINVELAQDALQLSALTAPFTGIVTKEDVTVAGQNVTTATSFSLADPSELVFRADVDVSDIDFVAVGKYATIQIRGATIPGSVMKIYPQKLTLPSGEEVYEVDIQAVNNLGNTTKLGETGNVLIDSLASGGISVLVPTWTVVGHNHMWVEENGKPVLLQVRVGQQHGNQTEISGLLPAYKIITNPAVIASQKYSLL